MAATASRWLEQGNADAALKFAPTRTALQEALQEAKNTYGQTVQAGNSTATLTQQAAKNAQPAIHSLYAGAEGKQQAGQAAEMAQLAALPGVANTYKAEAASEAQTHLANLLGAKTRDEAMLHQSGVQAREGAQFNQLNAQGALQKTLQGLFSKAQTGASERGLFAATEAEKLAHEAETLEQRERASERTASTSTSNNQRTTAASERDSQRAHPGTAGGIKELAPKDQQKGISTYGSIQEKAKALFSEGHSRAAVVHALQQPIPSKSWEDAQGVKHSTKGREGYAPNPVMSAALDVAQYGYVNPHHERLLQQEGYNPKRFGFVSEAAYKAKHQQGLPLLKTKQQVEAAVKG